MNKTDIWEEAIRIATERINTEFNAKGMGEIIRTSMEAVLNEYINLSESKDVKKTELAKYIVEQIGEEDMINLVEDSWEDIVLRILVKFEEKNDVKEVDSE